MTSTLAAAGPACGSLLRRDGPAGSTRSASASRSAAFVRGGERTSLLAGAAGSSASTSPRGAGRAPVRAMAADGPAAPTSGTPVKQTSMLVVGATGTLGRQVVRRALDEGYDVRCLVRARNNPADFLRDWGATTVSGDLTKPETLPPALVGIHTVVDAATSRPEEPIRLVDWEGKVALMQTAKAMGVQRYVFCSIDKCDKHPDVPLMSIKAASEAYLRELDMPYTVLRLCGFMQALIGQYAVPILEEKTVWGTTDSTRIAYLDTQDVARMVMAALRTDAAIGRTLTLAGPRAFTIAEVIGLCERLAGADAKVTKVPVELLKATRALTNLFQWSKDASDRLAFAEVLTSNEVLSADMASTYALLGLDPAKVTSVEGYLQEYYTRILKKLKEVGGQSRQNDFYL